MNDYYKDNLSARRLQRVYQIAPPRIQQYLRAEVEHVLSYIHPGNTVLDMGCGYGRIMPALAEMEGLVVGIDTSLSSLLLAKDLLQDKPNCQIACMDAIHPAFPDQTFDRVICIQNGISAFHVDKRALVEESIRVTKRHGTLLFSSYSPKFWKERLRWFELQAAEGLLGEIDYEKTGNGLIVCKDGFVQSRHR